MARKKKVVIVDQELTPTVLATIADKKKTSIFGIFWLIVIFGIFIGGVYYLDDIMIYVNSYLNPETSVIYPDSNPENNSSNIDTEPKEEIKEYEIEEGIVITSGDLELSNIQVERNELAMTITNISEAEVDFGKTKYFLYLYNSNKKLLQIIMLDEAKLATGTSIDVTYELSDASTDIIKFLNATEDEYPDYTLKSEGLTGLLTCQKGNETLMYSFNNNLLLAMQSSIEVNVNDEDYFVLSSTYQGLAGAYNGLSGVTSTINVDSEKMHFVTTIDLTQADSDSINIKHLYAKDTKPNVVYFELTASGYTCQ